MRPFDLVLRYQSGLKISTTILIFKCEPEARSPHILPTSLRNHLEDTSFRGEGQSEQSLKATARCACPPAVVGTAPGLRGGGCRASPRAQGAGSVPTARPRRLQPGPEPPNAGSATPGSTRAKWGPAGAHSGGHDPPSSAAAPAAVKTVPPASQPDGRTQTRSGNAATRTLPP